MTPTSTLVPPHRLGTLLSEQRHRTGQSIEDVVARLDHRISAAVLRDVEAGRRAVVDDDLRQLVPAYGVEAGALVPGRSELVIDLDAGTVSAGGRRGAIVEGRSGEILAQYLALVYELRDLPVGHDVPLRDLDLEVLGRALRLQPDQVEHRLQAMIADRATVSSRRRSLRQRLIVPAAGILVGATAVGALVFLTPESGPGDRGGAVAGATAEIAPPPVPGIDPEAPVELLPPANLER